MAGALALFIGFMVAGRISERMRMNALMAMTIRSESVIAAIKEYEPKTGGPPGTLNALVPEYMRSVPETGIGVTPQYRYETLTNGSTVYGNNKWILEVAHAGEADPFNFSTFIYLPMQDYSILHTTLMRKIGSWMYVYRG